MYGVVPPLIFKVAVPLLPLAQETLVVWEITLMVSGWLIEAVSENKHPNESIMVYVYIPYDKLVMSSVVSLLLQRKL